MNPSSSIMKLNYGLDFKNQFFLYLSITAGSIFGNLFALIIPIILGGNLSPYFFTLAPFIQLILVGILLAFHVWFVIMVNRNAQERGENAKLWALIVLLTSFIGAIVYYVKHGKEEVIAQMGEEGEEEKELPIAKPTQYASCALCGKQMQYKYTCASCGKIICINCARTLDNKIYCVQCLKITQ